VKLLCHDFHCQGHSERAGSSPDDPCRFCGASLVDATGACLLTADELPSTSSLTLRICEFTGHLWDGRYVDGELRGSCGRCGVTIRLVD
jgi:hypothetical protein